MRLQGVARCASRAAFAAAGTLLVAACSGGGSGPNAPAHAGGLGNTLGLTPTQTSFTSTGSQQRFTATEQGYTGTLNATSNDCSSIATFTPSVTSAPYTFTATSTAAGTCHITIADSLNQTAVETIVVTTTTGTVNGHQRR